MATKTKMLETHNDLSAETREEMISLLNQELADMSGMMACTDQAEVQRLPPVAEPLFAGVPLSGKDRAAQAPRPEPGPIMLQSGARDAVHRTRS